MTKVNPSIFHAYDVRGLYPQEIDAECAYRIARYFPDFLVETTKSRFLVVEVKSNREKQTYEKNKKEYKGKVKDLFDETFAKEVGFRKFQEANKQFEYHIIFDASFQKHQQELLELIRGDK